MRTSQKQFKIMITFMEQYGDLSNPSTGRMTNIRHWEKLTSLLNSDGRGDTKTTEKWRKVWSDFKNNTKKKAARLHKASRIGGGSAVRSELTDFEQRALHIIKKEAAASLAVYKAQFPQDVIEPSAVSVNAQSPLPSPIVVVKSEQSTKPCNDPGPSSRPHEVPMKPPQSHSPSPHIYVDDEIIEGSEEFNYPSVLATHPHVAEPVSEVWPAYSGQILRRHNRRTTRTRASFQRLVKSSRIEDAAQQFLHSDTEWREFKRLQHRDYMDMKREQNRIREMKVLAQREWQTIGLMALDLLDNFFSKYCKD